MIMIWSSNDGREYVYINARAGVFFERFARWRILLGEVDDANFTSVYFLSDYSVDESENCVKSCSTAQ